MSANGLEQVDALQWHDPQQPPFRLAGFAWFAQDRIYRRLPLKPTEKLPEAVDGLANSTAGGQIQFQSDTGRLSVRVQLRGVADMNHMPATGQCGFDLYIGPPGRPRYYSTTKYDQKQSAYEILLFQHTERSMRSFTLNFPLYQGVKEVTVGLDAQATVLEPPPYALTRRVVIYGTSITQGGCASRPGMAYTNILSRRLNVGFVNLGFSGSGKGEPEVARVMAGIPDPALFVLDYEANSESAELLRKTLPEFVHILRNGHPAVPILVVSRIRFAADLVQSVPRQDREDRRAFQKKLVESERRRGDKRIYFTDGGDFLGEDFDECTVDGVHPTDLGFLRIATGLEPVIRRVLFGRGKR